MSFLLGTCHELGTRSQRSVDATSADATFDRGRTSDQDALASRALTRRALIQVPFKSGQGHFVSGVFRGFW